MGSMHDPRKRRDRRSTSDPEPQQHFGWNPAQEVHPSRPPVPTTRRHDDQTSVSQVAGAQRQYWTPPRPGELPPTIIQRARQPIAADLMSRFGKPAMLGLTIAAVGTAGLWQSAQASTSTDSSGSAEDESRNIRPGDEQPASPASAIAEETDTSVAAQTIHRDEPYLYTVQERDEVRNIARAHGIHTMTVVWNNDLPDPDLIHPGQQLLILPVDGVLVEVQPGDTLRDLATYFGVNMTAIINYEPNGIIDPDVILPGQQLIIPGGAPPSPPSTGVSSVQSGDTEAQSGPASQAGETTVPASAQYDWDGEVVVEPGDTLGNIAHRFGVTASELAQANQIDDVDLIVPGAVLQVPDGETAPVETSQTQQDPPPAPVPEPDPDPVPAPDPEPDPPPPDPVPEPEPEADPPPQPQPDPTPTPVPDPPPQPEPTPTQQPAPDPTPTPQPDPDPEPASPSGDVPELLEYWAIQYDLDPNLLKAVAWVESGWNQNAVSVSGAQGVMQIMPGTGTWINNNLVSDNLNIAGSANDNIRAGAAYLRHMIDITGSVERGLAAYLQGPHTVQASGITESAQRYIDNVMRIRDHFAAHGTPP